MNGCRGYGDEIEGGVRQERVMEREVGREGEVEGKKKGKGGERRRKSGK